FTALCLKRTGNFPRMGMRTSNCSATADGRSGRCRPAARICAVPDTWTNAASGSRTLFAPAAPSGNADHQYDRIPKRFTVMKVMSEARAGHGLSFLSPWFLVLLALCLALSGGRNANAQSVVDEFRVDINA